MKDVTENEDPFFTEKTKTTNNIILAEKNLCQIFNTNFRNVTKDIQLRQVDESQSFENRK